MLPGKLFTPKSWQIWLNKKDLARTLKIVLINSSGQVLVRASGGNQSDYGCPRAGLRRESLSFLGGIRKIGC